MRKENVITIEEDIRIPGTDVLLEKGDRIEVLDEAIVNPMYRNYIDVVGRGSAEKAFASLINDLPAEFGISRGQIDSYFSRFM